MPGARHHAAMRWRSQDSLPLRNLEISSNFACSVRCHPSFSGFPELFALTNSWHICLSSALVCEVLRQGWEIHLFILTRRGVFTLQTLEGSGSLPGWRGSDESEYPSSHMCVKASMWANSRLRTIKDVSLEYHICTFLLFLTPLKYEIWTHPKEEPHPHSQPTCFLMLKYFRHREQHVQHSPSNLSLERV